MKQYKYKVKTFDGEQVIPDGSFLTGIGVVENGFIESDVVINNPNFEYTGPTQQPDPAPANLQGVVHQTQQPLAPAAPVQPSAPTTESEG